MSQTKAQLIDNLVQALSFTGTSTAPANGLFLSATNTLALSTNSAERLKIDGTEIVFNDIGSNIDFRVEGDTDANLLFVDASADKVGIGTSSPAFKLHVNGTSRFGSTRINSTTESTDGAFNDLVIGDYSSNRGISILSGATGQGAVGFAKSGTTADGYLAYVHNGTATSSAMTLKSQGHIKFNAGSSTKLYIEHDGNVGIGTTIPDGKLDVRGTIFVNGDGTGGRIFASSGNLSLSDGNGRQVLRIDDPGASNSHSHIFDSNGRLGIGTDSPDQLLHLSSTGTCKLRLEDKRTSISNTSQYGVIQFEQRDSNTPGVSTEIAAVMEDTTNGASGLQFKTGTPSTIDERVRIDRSGNVGIGTTTPSEKLHVNNASTFAGIKVSTTNNTTRAMIELNGKDGSGNEVELRLGGFGDTGRGEIFTVTNHELGFATNNAAAQMKLKTTGHLRLTSGNLEFASGAGIDFSAVSDGSRSIDSDGNKFDDYEEGSFTPTLTCQNSLLTASYINQDGKYTKIGRMVYFQIYIRLSAKSGGSGQLRVSNLPFSSSSATGAAYGGAYAAYTFNWDNDALDRMMIGSGSNEIQCFIGTSNGTNVNAGAGNLNSDTQMRILGSYHV